MNQTILVVDDDPASRFLAETLLGSAGYRTIEADSGAAALEVLVRTTPGLILLDVMMSRMDGFEALERLRKLPGAGAVPVILVSGLTDLGTVERALELGADDFIAKPLNRTELLLRVKTLLATKPARGAPPSFARRPDDTARLLVHDLKHPLTTIYFNAGLLKRDTGCTERAREKVARILRACERLESMILGLLDQGLNEDGALKAKPQPLDLSALVREVLDAMEDRTEIAGQRLEVRDDLGPKTVAADRDLLRRALENLLDNATKFGPTGGTVSIELAEREGFVELRVRDSGPGLSLETHADGTPAQQRRGRAGHGLGLLFVRRAVEAHGGAFSLETTSPEGTCFCIRLPSGTSRPTPLR